MFSIIGRNMEFVQETVAPSLKDELEKSVAFYIRTVRFDAWAIVSKAI